MFRKITNRGLICVLHADNESPLKLWDKKLRDGRLKRIVDGDMKGLVLEFTGKVPFSSNLSCPASVKSQLAIHYPYMVLTAKALDEKIFAFEVQVTDDTGTRRRFKFATGQFPFEVQPFHSKIPLVMEEGWNNVVVPLHHLTREIYGTRYVETLRLLIYTSCRIKKLYFADRDYQENELPQEFQNQQSTFSEHLLRKKHEEARRIRSWAMPERASAPHGNPCTGGKDSQRDRFTVRDVIPRVIPVNCNPKRQARTTYSAM